MFELGNMTNENQDETTNWKGTDKSMLPRSFSKRLFPSLIRSVQHTVLFKVMLFNIIYIIV
jgi:hypothetical protein